MDTNKSSSNSCRICFEAEDDSIFIFSDEAKKLHLQAKIRKYLYITITSEDNFPKLICNKCIKTLNWIHKFATMAVQTQDKFNKLLSNIVVSRSNQNGSSKKEEEYHNSLLHSYLTQDKTETLHKEDVLNDKEITEMEVRIDPMLILQCKDDSRSSSGEESSSSEGSGFEKDRDKNNGYRKPYQCNRCPKEFVTEFALQGHIWHHIQERKLLAFNINKFQQENLSICRDDEKDEIYEERDMNDEEMESNSKDPPFSCPVCGNVFSTRAYLKYHLETHQSRGKFGCDICGRIFKTETNLCRHKEYHEGLQHPCKVCGRVYPTNSTLRAHSITHSNVRPHKCHVCDKTFKRNQDLKFHINQHTGERPYQCPYCPKAFASSGNCFSHRKRMHPQEVERDREKALLM